jgi:hypothetical protein
LSPDHNITYIVNRMRTAFTRYVIIVKDPMRGGDVTHAILSGYLQSALNTSPLYDSEQFSMLIIPDSFFIQSVEPASTNLSKEEIYSDFDGWKFFTFLNASPGDYAIEINSSADLKRLPYPKTYDYKVNYQGDFEITGDFSGEWIVVKDHYFPTWVAEENGKRLRIEESNLGTLLIKTEPGSSMHLYHRPFWYEPPLAVLAIFYIFVVFILAYAISRKETHEHIVSDERPEDDKKR